MHFASLSTKRLWSKIWHCISYTAPWQGAVMLVPEEKLRGLASTELSTPQELGLPFPPVQSEETDAHSLPFLMVLICHDASLWYRRYFISVAYRWMKFRVPGAVNRDRILGQQSPAPKRHPKLNSVYTVNSSNPCQSDCQLRSFHREYNY